MDDFLCQYLIIWFFDFENDDDQITNDFILSLKVSKYIDYSRMKHLKNHTEAISSSMHLSIIIIIFVGERSLYDWWTISHPELYWIQEKYRFSFETRILHTVWSFHKDHKVLIHCDLFSNLHLWFDRWRIREKTQSFLTSQNKSIFMKSKMNYSWNLRHQKNTLMNTFRKYMISKTQTQVYTKRNQKGSETRSLISAWFFWTRRILFEALKND